MTLRTYLKAKRGRASRLADALGVSVALVSMWASHQRRIPAEQCYAIRSATGDLVPLCQLRPDLVRARRTNT